MDIRFYNWERELLCIVPKIKSVNWYVYYNDVGTFEMHMNMSTPQAKRLLEQKYIIAESSKLQAVIVIKKIEKNELILYGRTLNWFLTKRVVLPFSERTRNTVKEVENCIPDYMTFKEFSGVVTETENTVERTNAETAETAVSALLSLVDLGHEVRLEKSADGSVGYIFSIIEGEEKPITLSEELRNVSELTFTEDGLDYCSSGYYLKDEEWIRIDKDNRSGIYNFEGVLTSDNKADGANELKELRWKKICEGKVRSLKYKKDYEVGDIIKIKFKKGDFRLTTRYRIAGVHLWYEGESEGEEPSFEEVVD